MKSSRAKKNSFRSLRIERLENRQMLDASPFLGASAIHDAGVDIRAADTNESLPKIIDLSGYPGYKSYEISAREIEGTFHAVLAAADNGVVVTLQTWRFDSYTEVIFNGNSKVAETLTITSSALANLTSSFTFNGNNRDSLVIEGQSGGANTFVTGNNGTMSRVRVNSKEIDFSADLSDITLLGGSDTDTLTVYGFNSNYTFDGGAGQNILDFKEADGTLKIDLSKKSAQKILSGGTGKLRLLNAEHIAKINGTTGGDVITGVKKGASGLEIYGNGGPDKITVFCGLNVIDLRGFKQQITIRDTASCQLNLTNAGCSNINASSAKAGTYITGLIAGDGIKFTGGKGNVGFTDNDPTKNEPAHKPGLNVTGDFFLLRAASAGGVNLAVTGNRAAITTGKGADNVYLEGDSAVIKTGKGDDVIRTSGSYNAVDSGDGDDVVIADEGFGVIVKTGNGNDRILLQNAVNALVCAGNDNDLIICQDDFKSHVFGCNNINGGAGDDIILAPYSRVDCLLEGCRGNDILLGGRECDALIDSAGKNMLVGMDGTDNIASGSGADILVSSVTCGLMEILKSNDLIAYKDNNSASADSFDFYSPLGDELQKILNLWVAGDRESVLKSLNQAPESYEGNFCLPDDAQDMIVDNSGNNLIYYNPSDDYDIAVVKLRNSADRFFEKAD